MCGPGSAQLRGGLGSANVGGGLGSADVVGDSGSADVGGGPGSADVGGGPGSAHVGSGSGSADVRGGSGSADEGYDPGSAQLGGGPVPTVCFRTKPNESIPVEHIVKIFESGNISETRTCAPSAGDVYLFDIDVIGKDWRCDDYLWRQNGTCKFPNRNPVAKKTYYKMSLKNHYKKKTCSNKCSKNTYVSLNKPNLVLVHYSGDENQYVPKCHGNKKISQERPYKRTCPSTIASIK